jgi:hypothetical protein
MGQNCPSLSNKRPNDCPPAATAATPGVWVIDRPDRPKPFGVQWRERRWDPLTKTEKEEKRTEFFSSASERDKRRGRLYADKVAGRTTDLPRDEQEEWRAFKAAAAGLDWRIILANHHAWQQHTGTGATTPLVKDFASSYLADCAGRVERGEMSKANLSHKKTLLKKFCATFGNLALHQPKSEAVEKWLAAQGHASPHTFNSHRKVLFTLFNQAVPRLISHNPIADLRRRRAVVDNRKRLLTPPQTAQLFHTALTIERFRPLLNRLALEAFLGIRFSSAYRLQPGDVRAAERAIMLPGPELKTGVESGEGHFVDGAPEQLWAWLAIAPQAGWDITPRQYLALKSLLFVAAGVPHPPNCLRKSFATYDLAAHKNPGRTAYFLGHTNQRELWRSYKGNASKADGELYQQITPATCAEIARGGRLPA